MPPRSSKPFAAVLAISLISLLQLHAQPAGTSRSDVAAARALFERNLEAIRHRDRAAYLACYRRDPKLARVGPEGALLGFDALAKSTSDTNWPDFFEARDLRLLPVQPGTVYGTYRYRVRYGEREENGLSERFFTRTPQGWRIAVTSAFPAPPGTPPSPLALVGASLVDGTGAPPVADAVIVIREGRIDCAGARAVCAVPAGVEVIEVRGLWATPGLVDAHVHFCQTGWADGRPDSLDVRDRYPYEQVQAELRSKPERFFRSYLCSGVTAAFDVGGYPWTWALPSRTEKDSLAPRVVAAGPLLSTRDFWLNLPGERQFIYLSDEKAAREAVRYVASQGAKHVKIWFIPVEDRSFEEIAALVKAAGEEAARLQLPLIVHATALREAKSALQAGARLLVHGVGDAAIDDEFIALAKAKGTIYCPTLTVRAGYVRMFMAVVDRQAPAIDDPNGCVDPVTLAHVAESATVPMERVSNQRIKDPAGREAQKARWAEQEKLGAANLARVAAAGIPIAMGTDAGNPLTLPGPSVYAEMEAMQAAGLTPGQVLTASTRGGALAMDRLGDLGTIEPNKAADLLLVAGDPTADIANLRKLRFVVRGGVVRALGELQASAKR